MIFYFVYLLFNLSNRIKFIYSNNLLYLVTTEKTKLKEYFQVQALQL
jgi:hypothetical protein